MALGGVGKELLQSRKGNLPSQRRASRLGIGLLMGRIAAKVCSGNPIPVLLLFVLIPLTPTIQGTQVKGLESAPLSCQPSVQNQFPQNASAGQTIVIVTTVTSACVTAYDQVIVNILPPNSSELLSTAPANPAATNTVAAPATAGPLTLIVQVMWNNYPTGGTFEIYQTTITVKIIGSFAISTVPSRPPPPTSGGRKHRRPFGLEQVT
jgi:hypothetical protein